jgi:hypothetical protein
MTTYSYLRSLINSQTLNVAKLKQEIQTSSIETTLDHISANATHVNITFMGDLSQVDNNTLNSIVDNHVDNNDLDPKIWSICSDDLIGTDFTAIDYRTQLKQTLWPKRYFTKGELRLVEWYADQQLTNMILKVEIAYQRDPFGFPISRTTTRTWINNANQSMVPTKVTVKDYTVSPLSQIQEGKTRRGNIVDGIQLPTFSFMIQVLTQSPYSKSINEILLMGREFMDRFEGHFDTFIKNSSTITDPQSPNFGRKTVVVRLEEAAASTDPWLNEHPAGLQGASILEYLIDEFSI